ncbi:hypothetical protein [Streptomyces chartreusis]
MTELAAGEPASGVRIAIVCDNCSPHLTTKRCQRVATWAAANNVQIAYTPANRSKGPGQSANTTFAYHVSNNEESWTSTSPLKADGTPYDTTHSIYDSLLRQLQVQSPAATAGQLLTDTRYDCEDVRVPPWVVVWPAIRLALVP